MVQIPPADQAPTLVLAPLDQGVHNVGGRPGAAQGPDRLHAALETRGLLPAGTVTWPLELVNEPGALEADLDRLAQAVETVLTRDGFPLVLGGDHGTTYATVRGAAGALDRVSVTYLDVHLDMRPYAPVHTSGSSFRRLVEEGHVAPGDVHPLGIQRPEDPKALERSGFDELAAWAQDTGVSWRSMAELREAGLTGTVLQALAGPAQACLSFDVDCLSDTLAPGVSAPGPDRFELEEVIDAVAAASDRCKVFDVVEYAPPLDEGQRTLESVTRVLGTLLQARWTG